MSAPIEFFDPYDNSRKFLRKFGVHLEVHRMSRSVGKDSDVSTLKNILDRCKKNTPNTDLTRVPEFLINRHMNVVRLSALSTGRFYPQKYSC